MRIFLTICTFNNFPLAFSSSLAGTSYYVCYLIFSFFTHFNSLFSPTPIVCSTSAVMDIICRGCNKPIKTNVATCDHCTQNYHPSCTVFKQVRNKANILINACRSCITTANKQKTESMNESNAENLATATKPASASTDELHSMLLGKMDKLDKLDGIETKISNFQVALTNVTDKIAEFTDKLQILDTIPVLIQRIDVATEDIDKLKSDFNSVRFLMGRNEYAYNSIHICIYLVFITRSNTYVCLMQRTKSD